MKKLSISVPQDVADTLAEQPNASAYVTEAVRGRMRLDALRAELAESGIEVTEAGLAAARARRATVDMQWPAERYDVVRDRVRQHLRDEESPAGQAPAA
ncbi:hypothetical protein O7623_21450 [Solwaraspora sp. WMMD791]|uniref:hypothetical protein n=1 Tax=unclassified Solwaraspora TaxID=2627926 RepID=UPI00249C3ABF|nr:hypothetical protein [Solwaraspora sp. WMMD791]WFE25913.1 hypothetical protein O7623_21450 [Solwaraspora sp. WMMD791]